LGYHCRLEQTAQISNEGRILSPPCAQDSLYKVGLLVPLLSSSWKPHYIGDLSVE
jgi:hypothetical protein